MFCEMVKMDALFRHDANAYRLLDYAESMHPIGAQLCGSKPELAGPCSRILEDLGFDVIDLNCGCPVDKVTKDQSGSGLLKNPQKIGDIVANMVAAVKVPITVKIRAGWDEKSIVAPEIAQIVEKAGAKILFVHGRTRAQAYRGPANWDYIKECKQAVKNMSVFGNGDIIDPKSAEKIFARTQCDGLLLSRGTFGNPWIFEDLARYFAGKPALLRSKKEILKMLQEHIDFILDYKNKQRTLIDLRRVGAWYLRQGGSSAKKLREIVATSDDLEEIKRQLHTLDWEEFMVEMHAAFHGQVQGVGFRATTKRLAGELGLKGTVRNKGGSMVEIVAQGEKNKLETLLEKLQQSFDHGSLKLNVEYFEPKSTFEDFSIIT